MTPCNKQSIFGSSRLLSTIIGHLKKSFKSQPSQPFVRFLALYTVLCMVARLPGFNDVIVFCCPIQAKLNIYEENLYMFWLFFQLRISLYDHYTVLIVAELIVVSFQIAVSMLVLHHALSLLGVLLVCVRKRGERLLFCRLIFLPNYSS